MYIKLEEIEIFKSETQPVPHKYNGQVNLKIHKILVKNIIKKCNSRFIDTIVVEKKFNEELRIFLDARNLNQYTVKQYTTS